MQRSLIVGALVGICAQGVKIASEIRTAKNPDDVCTQGLAGKAYAFDEPIERMPYVGDKEPIKVWDKKAGTSLDWNKKGDTFAGVADRVAAVYEGWIYIPQDDEYTFGTASDDGSLLWVDDLILVDNDGLHSRKEVKSEPTFLTEGMHKLQIDFFENTGAMSL